MLIAVFAAAYASEAPWYKWRNRVSGAILCSQTSPGTGWTLYRGPYMEAACRKPGNPQ